MEQAETLTLLRETMLVVLKLAGPPLLTGLFVGLLVSLLQTVTQINEATLAFVPKVLAVGAVLLLLGPCWRP
jgi:flagellar biosynthetic protein FliQ